ncbi:hypothetical protein RRG08_008145 [Elysia crispata]|uniref:C2H2-type domain-containing protein n=1 Tax=Elysia crispata TaxID=231223 RepID=A0AAE1DB32_9GAST|nr:hypothetical protein RRG08_008145 [Elysia crispata]
MRGTNSCEWLLLGKTYICGRSCMGKYCSVHNARIAKGGGTIPCIGCGVGPRKYRHIPPPRKAKARKRKAIQEKFDPIASHKVLRSVGDYQEELLGLFEEPEEIAFRRTRWTLGNFLRGWQMDVPQGHPQGADPRIFLQSVEPQIREKLEEELRALRGGLKFQLALKVELVKVNPDGSEEFMEPVLRHRQEAVLQESEIATALEEAFPRLQETLEKLTQRGSGWAVVQVRKLWLDIARYQPLRGGSYIPLPPELKNKKAVVNVKNMDDHCLRWALRSALFQAADHPYRPANYPAADGLDFTGIDAPTPISQIGKVERQNDLAINVFGWEKGVIVHHISKQPEDMPRTNLLLIQKAGKFHYTWIKNLNRLLHDQNKNGRKKHFCERCLHGYSREDLLEAHSPHHESRRAGARPDKKQHPEDTTPRGMQLLLRSGAVRREDRGACPIPGAQRSRTLPPSSRSGRAWDPESAGETARHENDKSRLGEPQDCEQMPCV